MLKEKIKNAAERGSKYIAKRFNPALTRITVDTGALASIAYGAEQLPTLSSPTIATLSGGAALGIYGLDKIVSKLIRKQNEKNPMTSRLQTAALAGILAISSYSLYDKIVDIYRDLDNILSDDAQTEETSRLSVSRNYILPNFSSVRLANKGTAIGDVQRTYRWKPIIDAVENRHNIPRGTMGGLIMQESYGDPLQPNATADGGIGLIHTQGTTAKTLGLNIYGDSNSDHDPMHGRQLNKMFHDCNYALECVAENDDRAHPLKNLDSIARYMIQGYNIHRNWDDAIQWVRGPGLVNRITGRNYLAKIKEKRNAFNTLVSEAEEDFNNRNPEVKWDTYQDAFHRMCEENFDLENYM